MEHEICPFILLAARTTQPNSSKNVQNIQQNKNKNSALRPICVIYFIKQKCLHYYTETTSLIFYYIYIISNKTVEQQDHFFQAS